MKMFNSILLFLVLFACDSNDDPSQIEDKFASVTKVEVSGRPEAYRFAVTVSSPDQGCDQYANWWEILSEDGKLIYRRILLHSHVDEQPFTRTGAGIQIEESQIVYVRAHMNNIGYGGQVMKGTVQGGFTPAEIAENFANDVEKEEPLPERCAF